MSAGIQQHKAGILAPGDEHPQQGKHPLPFHLTPNEIIYLKKFQRNVLLAGIAVSCIVAVFILSGKTQSELLLLLLTLFANSVMLAFAYLINRDIHDQIKFNRVTKQPKRFIRLLYYYSFPVRILSNIRRTSRYRLGFSGLLV